MFAALYSVKQKGYQISMKIWIFDDPFHKKGAIIVYFGANDDSTIRIRKFFDEIELWRLQMPMRLIFMYQFFWYGHKISSWILAPFLSEALEARWCYFFEKWLMKLKLHHIYEKNINSSTHLSHLDTYIHFTMIYLVGKFA